MLEIEYKKIIKFLNRESIDYLVIGGIAASIHGNPRGPRILTSVYLLKRHR